MRIILRDVLGIGRLDNGANSYVIGVGVVLD